MVSNITVSLGLVFGLKALAMARLSVLGSPLAILPPSTLRFRPLAPYCPISWHLTAKPLPGWHPTAYHQLAPYCCSCGGTLLLIVVGWHPLCPVAPLTIYPSDRLAPRLRLVVV